MEGGEPEVGHMWALWAWRPRKLCPSMIAHVFREKHTEGNWRTWWGAYVNAGKRELQYYSPVPWLIAERSNYKSKGGQYEIQLRLGWWPKGRTVYETQDATADGETTPTTQIKKKAIKNKLFFCNSLVRNWQPQQIKRRSNYPPNFSLIFCQNYNIKKGGF